MVYKFGLDLRVARRRAALTQSDCAHLLGTDQPRISKFETGTAIPTVVELSILYLLFDKSLGRASEEIIAALRDELERRLASMPATPLTWRDRQRRLETLAGMAQKLLAINPEEYA